MKMIHDGLGRICHHTQNEKSLDSSLKLPLFAVTKIMSKNEKTHPMIPVPEAIRIVIRESARALLNDGNKPSKTLSSDAPWSDLLNSVLDCDVTMAEPGYPSYNASIMDGYAIRTKDVNLASVDGEGWTHEVIDKVYAGDINPPNPVDASKSALPLAYYITTGAVVPDSFDCVVPIEECQVALDKKQIRIKKNATIQENKWIRPIGCDIPKDSIVLPRGHTIDSVALGLLKQSGVSSIQIKRPIVVGVLSTGNELITEAKHDSIQLGKIPDVNRPILLNLLSTFKNCETLDLGMERDDDIVVMARTLEAAILKCDVIITTGGISMGESDIIEKVLVDHCGGTLHFGRLHMKPGKPTTFVTIPRAGRIRLVFAMPGNPVSASVCTHLLVKPCLDLLFHGVKNRKNISLNEIADNAVVHSEITAKLTHDIKLDAVRPEYHRVTINRTSDGTFEVASTGVQRSSRLMSMRDAMGLLVLPVGSAARPKVLVGETYPVLLLGDDGGLFKVSVRNSEHLKPKKKQKQFKVAVVEVLPKDMRHLSRLDATCDQISDSLSGSKSGSVVIVSKKVFADELEEMYPFCIDSNDADFIIISCVPFEGSFQFHLHVTSFLRKKLIKVADAIALQARQGAASQEPKTALFECLVGYAPEGKGAMVVSLPMQGLHGGLSNIRGVLKHALNVARGQPHNKHHQ